MAVQAEEMLKQPKAGKKDVGQISQWRLMARRFWQNKLSVIGLIGLIIMYLMALFASFLSPNPYTAIDSDYQWAPPSDFMFANGGLAICSQESVLDPERFEWVFTTNCDKPVPIQWFIRSYNYNLAGLIPTNIHLFGVEAPAKLYLWGADDQGRDIFAETLQGARVSLTVGLLGVAIAVLIGSVLGTASGYFGGAIDNIMQRVIELIMTFPTLPLWAALAAALPQDLPVVQRYFFITVVLSLVGWTGLARQVRGKVMGYRSADYTSAALIAGSSHSRIILTHMLPNALSHIIVVAALAVPATILGETALSFLGLGMLRPAVSWGVLLRDAMNVQAVTTYPWLLIPGVAVILAVSFYQFLGDGLRDAVDPYG